MASEMTGLSQGLVQPHLTFQAFAVYFTHAAFTL